ncbi:hypothetical protein EJP82_26060 [Paenibacillus anaericanus]|uniref:TcpE family protein n=1 Tax=Paenibacillus anaericanus TaxID=170367 RepID=A0A433XXB2_9BACL|nr:TcpE family conjugal transfer membrane protein [Paenibacillus anaericanus]RUT39498.1 hypothetical protein EJP82_26060 [Paenibacillus anaericanus]
MYRTYVKLFRVKPEITTLGTGTKVIRLPKEYWITADVGIITFVILPIIRFTIAPILSSILGAHSLGPALVSPINWVLAFIVSFLIAVYLRRYDPEGKSVVKWVWDYTKYFIQPKWSDGWTKCKYDRTKIDFSIQAQAYQTQRNICGSLPAEGQGIKKFALYKPANIVIKRGKVKFIEGKNYGPGVYEVQGNRISRISDLPKKRREGKHE